VIRPEESAMSRTQHDAVGRGAQTDRRRRRSRGSSIVEFALIAPVLMLTMLTIFDFGFYIYAFIGVQNAARNAALRNSGGVASVTDVEGACSLVLEELRGLPNTGAATGCTGQPITVSSVSLCPSSPCTGVLQSPDGEPAVKITVTYRVPDLLRPPFVEINTITRTSQMKLRSIQ
jgi:hypothetical protein